jgi:hypothetical protein
MSAIEKLKERMSAMETELAELRNEINKTHEPWWKAWMGAFQEDPLFEQAMKYGQQWRRGQKPKPAKKKRKPKS